MEDAPSVTQTSGPRDSDVREMRITRRLLDKFGFSTACDGCNAVQYGLPQRVHNNECRRRLYEEMSKDPEERPRLEKALNRTLGKAERTALRESIENEEATKCDEPQHEEDSAEPESMVQPATASSNHAMQHDEVEGAENPLVDGMELAGDDDEMLDLVDSSDDERQPARL